MKDTNRLMRETYLAHYGVQGMKWGVRRYQNPDGTLTSEGKKRNALIRKTRNAMKTTSKKQTRITMDGKKVALMTTIITFIRKPKEDHH